MSGGSRLAICSPTSMRSSPAHKPAVAKARARSTAPWSMRCSRARVCAGPRNRRRVSAHDLQRSRSRDRRSASRDRQDIHRRPLAHAYTAGGFRVRRCADRTRSPRAHRASRHHPASTLTRLALTSTRRRAVRHRAGGVDPRRGRDGEHPRDCRGDGAHAQPPGSRSSRSATPASSQRPSRRLGLDDSPGARGSRPAPGGHASARPTRAPVLRRRPPRGPHRLHHRQAPRRRLHIIADHHASAAERVAVAAWRERQARAPGGQAVLIARATSSTN